MQFVIVDIETTGGNPKESKITEIALYKTDGRTILDEYSTLVNPGIPIPEFIVNLTGISNEMVKDAPAFYEIARKIVEFTEGAVFVAHNVSFDYNVIRHEFRSLGFDFRRPQLCTVVAAREIIPGHESYSLGKLSRKLGIVIKGRHRAGGDALATTELFHLLFAKNPELSHSLVKQDINPKSLSPDLDLASIEELPAKMGIYLCYNNANQVIYIGKSKNIKRKVNQQLRTTRSKANLEFLSSLYRVDYILSGSELIAILLENSLLIQHQPQYNRSVRKELYAFGLYQHLNPEQYIHLYVDSTRGKKEDPLVYFSTKNEAQGFIRSCIRSKVLIPSLCSITEKPGTTLTFNFENTSLGIAPDVYNQQLIHYLDTITAGSRSFIIIDNGRSRSEKSIVLIENGEYRGYGYVSYQAMNRPVSELVHAINRCYETPHQRSIINHYLRKNKKLSIIRM